MRANVGVLRGSARKKVIRKWVDKNKEYGKLQRKKEWLQKEQDGLRKEITKLRMQLIRRKK